MRVVGAIISNSFWDGFWANIGDISIEKLIVVLIFAGSTIWFSSKVVSRVSGSNSKIADILDEQKDVLTDIKTVLEVNKTANSMWSTQVKDMFDTANKRLDSQNKRLDNHFNNHNIRLNKQDDKIDGLSDEIKRLEITIVKHHERCNKTGGDNNV